MIKFLLITLFAYSLYGVEIDYSTLEKIIATNPNATNERLILAKYYEKNSNDLKAMSLVDEVLQVDANNKNALKIRKKIAIKKRVRGIFREAGLATPINSLEAQKRLDSYYKVNNYQFYSNLYQALVDSDVQLEDSYHIKAAYIYLWDAHYDASENALDSLQQRNNLDAAKIHADIYYYRGDYKHAVRLYEKLYSSSYSLDIALKLLNSYIYLGKIQKAQRIYTFLVRKNPHNKTLAQLGAKITTSKGHYLSAMKKAYEADKNIKTVTQYANALYSANKKDATIALLHAYNKEHSSHDSLLLEAKYLVWMGHTKDALSILSLNELNDDLAAKLMLGKIYSWDQEYKKSIINLQEVIQKSQDKNMLFEAKNALGHVYLWQKKDVKAKEMFQALQKERPANEEVKEALMQLNHDYKGLLKIYKRKAYKSNNQGDVKYLAQLYALNKNYDMAIKILQSYIEDNPNDLEANKTLGLMLIEQKKYYQGFGYLEYYAAYKQTAQSGILLARNYYWHGFSKEALDVLNKVIEKEQNKKIEDNSLIKKVKPNSDLAQALHLKAKILKVAPRFTTSNSGATTATYYDDLGKKQLFLADTLYFNAHYKASLMYYQDYLQSHPNDHKARYRYAFALENAKEYGKAEGEFSLIFWTKDSDELRYHYAYNMMKNGKLDASKKLLLQLKESTFAKADANVTAFLDAWKGAWESLDFTKYASYYSKKFGEDEMWAFKKQANFANAKFISVGIYDPIEKKIAKNSYRIRFYQEYATDKKSDKGYKTLEIKCANHKTECQITKESWEKGKYQKALLLMPYIEKSLKENAYLKAHPLAFMSKKKSLQYKKKDTKFHDIYLAEGLKKNYKSEQETFERVHTHAKSVKFLNASQISPTIFATPNYLSLAAYSFEDSDTFYFRTIDLLYKRSRITFDVSLAVDVGLINFGQRNIVDYKGVRYGGTLFYKNFSLRLGMNNFENFSEFVPTLKYTNKYKNNSYGLEYTRQNAIFYTYAIKAFKKRIEANHFGLSDTVNFDNKTQLWFGIDYNNYTNDDNELTGNFNWRFYKNTAFTPKFTYTLNLEGWYTAHSKQHSDFYSPRFADATLVRVDPQYVFSKQFGLRGEFGTGYSFSDKDVPYKYGLWAFGKPMQNMNYKLGCHSSNSARITAGGNYHYKECKANLGYSW